EDASAQARSRATIPGDRDEWSAGFDNALAQSARHPKSRQFHRHIRVRRSNGLGLRCTQCSIERIRRADVGPRAGNPRAQVLEQLELTGIGAQKMKRMDGPPLADAIDAADSLLEPH